VSSVAAPWPTSMAMAAWTWPSASMAGRTRLFRNVFGAPGVRVALRGPKGESTAVGAMVRLKFGERFGPAREIHAGSGYWSQDSATLVLAAVAPTTLQVRWPSGRAQDWRWPVDLNRLRFPLTESSLVDELMAAGSGRSADSLSAHQSGETRRERADKLSALLSRRSMCQWLRKRQKIFVFAGGSW
jgi:hypothetical protein